MVGSHLLIKGNQASLNNKISAFQEHKSMNTKFMKIKPLILVLFLLLVLVLFLSHYSVLSESTSQLLSSQKKDEKIN
jgi:hypothetical protein